MRWARHHPGGYEVSTRGDRRFSALNARLPDGRTIEQHYQCDVKGYDPGGLDWRKGKGRTPLRQVDLWAEYLQLWAAWAVRNSRLLDELHAAALVHDSTLTDCFATSEVNQARALAFILSACYGASGSCTFSR